MTTHKQRFGHVNATNRNSYLNIICIKLVTQAGHIVAAALSAAQLVKSDYGHFALI